MAYRKLYIGSTSYNMKPTLINCKCHKKNIISGMFHFKLLKVFIFSYLEILKKHYYFKRILDIYFDFNSFHYNTFIITFHLVAS